MCFQPHRRVQAESVDVGAQRLVHCGLAWRRTPQGQHLLPGAGAEGNAIGDRRGLQWPQSARLLAVGIRLGQVGLAHLLDQHASAREQLHQPGDDRLQQRVQFVVGRDGNKLYGPGIADDKGGVAVILHSLAILQRAGWRDYGKLVVLFNPDEESGSPGSGETIAALGEAADVVLSYEPSPAKAVLKAEAVLLAAAGTATVTMEVKGRSSHAGAAPDQGRNALIELAHQLLQTQDVARGIPGAQLNWTMVDAITTRNQVPARAVAGADVRLTAPGAAEKLLPALRAKVAESRRVPDTETTVTMAIGRPPYAAGERGKALAEKARAIYAELDGRELAFIPGSGGGTDAGFAGRSGKPAVLESLGLAGWGYHAKDEYIEIDSIVPRLYLTTRLLMELGAGR